MRGLAPGRSAAATSVLLAALVATGPAAAADLPGPDAASAALGGLPAADGRSPGAFVLNPALLAAGAPGLQGYAGLAVDARTSLSRRPGVDALAAAVSPLAPRAFGHAGVSALLGLGVAAGAWYQDRGGPTAAFPGHDPDSVLVPGAYDRDRYGALAYRLRESEAGLALAWQATRHLAVGAAFAGRFVGLAHERVVWTGTAARRVSEPESTADDLRVALDLRDRFVPVGYLGLWLRPLRALRLGLAAELPGEARLDGSASAQVTRPAGRVTVLVPRADASLRLRLPASLSAGLGVDVGRVSLDVAGRHTWAPTPRTPAATTRTLVIQHAEAALGGAPIRALPLGFRWRSRLELAAGLAVRAWPPALEVRLGYAFVQGSVDPAMRSAALVDPDQHRFTVGLGLRLRRWRLDLTYGRVQATATTGVSLARQTNVLAPDATTVIGAARQTRSGDVVLVTAGFTLPAWR
jgi:hypothetical protein